MLEKKPTKKPTAKPKDKTKAGTDFYTKKGKKSILVPFSKETHKKIRIAAAVAEMSMNKWVESVVEAELKRLTS